LFPAVKRSRFLSQPDEFFIICKFSVTGYLFSLPGNPKGRSIPVQPLPGCIIKIDPQGIFLNNNFQRICSEGNFPIPGYHFIKIHSGILDNGI
jgi:hypothetical protein